jgi:hypothetical protein
MKNKKQALKISELKFKKHTGDTMPNGVLNDDLIVYKCAKFGVDGNPLPPETITHLPQIASHINWGTSEHIDKPTVLGRVVEYAIIKGFENYARKIKQLSYYYKEIKKDKIRLKEAI